MGAEGQQRGANEEIYENPADYDLEVAAHAVGDLPFWTKLIRRERPRRVLEVGCGTGRLTLPLAQLGAAEGFTIVGLEPVAQMLQQATEHAATAPDPTRAALRFVAGDIRDCMFEARFIEAIRPVIAGR